MPGPKEALAPAWKFVPVTVTVRLAPGAPELGDRLEIVGTMGKLTVALAEVPSAKVAVTEKLPPGAKTALNSEANRKKTLPSATAKLTVPLPALRRAPSRLAAVLRAQLGDGEPVSQAPALARGRSSSRVTVRAPLPGSTVTRKLPSRAPSGLKAAAPGPTLSRSLPRKARLIVAGGGAIVNPPGRTPDWPLGFETVTSRGPIAAVAPIARGTESWVAETSVVEVTVMPGPKEALAPAWKFVPVTVTVRLAPGAPELGDRLEIVGTMGKLTVALAEVPSARVAVTEKLEPGAKTALNSEANRKKTLPSATAKLTVPLPSLRRAPSRLAAGPRAQLGVAASVSQAPALARWRSSSRVTVRAPLPGATVTRKLPSRAPSGLKAAAPGPTLSRSLPRKARLIVAGGGATVNPPGRTPDWPLGLVTVTSRGPIAAVAPIARGTESWVAETSVVEGTVMPGPKEALAPAWKFVPVTVTERLAP